ncbi:hypothetical protein J4456_02495 [Candidatus Pacearchaeota archaeon]|nr:hypothetical protein [Candidatus Pacearchaeota archaeon]
MLPLYDISLTNLSKIKKEIERMTQEELTAYGFTPSRSGNNHKAFYDRNLESLLKELDAYEIKDPDVKVVSDENVISFVYSCDMQTEEYKPTLVKTGSFVRDAARILKDINWAMSTSKKMYEYILEKQKGYLATNDVSQLQSLTQETVGEALHLSNTTISRLMNGKSIRSLDGCIMPLASLIINQDKINKLRIYEMIAPLIGQNIYTYSDKEAVNFIFESTGIKIAERTVRKYRHELESRKLSKVKTEISEEF